jgi:hypothetical protein
VAVQLVHQHNRRNGLTAARLAEIDIYVICAAEHADYDVFKVTAELFTAFHHYYAKVY